MKQKEEIKALEVVENNMRKTIVIVGAEITANKDDVFESLNNDVDLIEGINQFAKDLKKNNIEIFVQQDNILVTEKGYYIAVFPEDVKRVEE